MSNFPPALLFIGGAFCIPLLPTRLRAAFMLLLPVLGFFNVMTMPEGTFWVVPFLQFDLIFGHIDRLSKVWGYIFHIITFLAVIYALHIRRAMEYWAAFIYAGAALGVVFAGDLVTLFIFWEVMTIGSTCLILARNTESARKAAFRYALIHIAGGLLLLAGIVLKYHQTGSIEFGFLGLHGMAHTLIFLGFGVNCAWPFFHAWLPDAYPEASVTGTVVLSAFTTKTAVYVLARSFPGTPELIVLGGIMAAFPIFYAVIENDLRKVLSYSLINQVGFMMVGVGIGTELSINGTAAHAFAHILYKALLFMSMGAVLYRTGKINGTDLGGLHKSMPLTTIFCIIGAASISGFPLTSGFISKAMIISACGAQHLAIIWLVLIFASAGVFHHSGIKIPYFAFFAHDSGIRTKEAPLNMLIAMGLAAFLCIFLGVFPQTLYSILPYPEAAAAYVPYSASHVVLMLQLLFFSALAFTILMITGIYPPEMRGINVDCDIVWRRGSQFFFLIVKKIIAPIDTAIGHLYRSVGLVLLMILARFLSWFDWNGIDGLVDGSAHCVRSIGRRVSLVLQRGQIQQTIYYTVTFVAVILVAFVWL